MFVCGKIERALFFKDLRNKLFRYYLCTYVEDMRQDAHAWQYVNSSSIYNKKYKL